MSETPRTEEALIDNSELSDWGTGKSELVRADFARQLETELREARLLLSEAYSSIDPFRQPPESELLYRIGEFIAKE